MFIRTCEKRRSFASPFSSARMEKFIASPPPAYPRSRKMANGRMSRLKSGAVEEAKKVFRVFVYLWVFLTVLSLHKAFIFNEDILTYQQGFAFINALALSKIVVVGQDLRLGDRITRKLPLIYTILFKSAVFAALTIFFHIIEETLIGMWHGKPATGAIPTLGDGSLQALSMLAIIVFVALIPFFGFLEISEALGPEKLRAILLRRKSLPDERA
ncbi:hypothetical protein [Methylocystis heyeri]|uniref:Uncharacterized protein n=1 Tax=Methylocystis heyeri TaxID=391905 RepID=A0A6B8KF82_9HYPH|nr:hypothetical protein [Methylocystis heyeri]QGM46357.1 hypothetical protein H2LOC_011965 [Methylocystis heyeri]